MEARLNEIMLRVSCSPLIDAGRKDEAIRLVLDCACEGLNVARAGIWFLRGDIGSLHCELLIDKAEHTETTDIVLNEADYPRYFSALHSERTIVADDACNDPVTSEFRDGYLVPLGVTSMMDVPIRHHGRMIGIICAEHTGSSRHWTADEISFAGGLGDLVGRVINAHEALAGRDATEASLRAITASTSRSRGEDFFRQLGKDLAASLDVFYVSAGEVCVSDGVESVQTLAVGGGQDFMPKIS